MIFDPRLVFCVIWATQVVGYLMFGDDFNAFELLTWAVVEVAMIAFLCGATLASYLPLPQRVYRAEKYYNAGGIRRFVKLALVVYLLMFAFALVQLYTILVLDAGGSVSGASLRQAVITDFLGERKILQVLRIFFFGVGLCVYLLAYASFLSRRVLMLILALGLVSAIVTSGRLYLLLFFIASGVLLYRQKIISLRAVATGGLGFIVLFFVVAIVLGKGGDDEPVLVQLAWNGKVYVLSSLACFNNFVQTGDQRVLDGMLLPNFARDVINLVFDAGLSPKPDLNPFAFVPIQCNTYTSLFQLFHDGGLWLVGAAMLLIGVFQRYLFRYHLVSSSRLSWYLFGLSMYPLIMSIFEDAYTSSIGFWVLLWIPPALHAVFNKLCVRGAPAAAA